MASSRRGHRASAQHVSPSRPRAQSFEYEMDDEMDGYSLGPDGWEFHHYEDDNDDNDDDDMVQRPAVAPDPLPRPRSRPTRSSTPSPTLPRPLEPPPPTLCRFFVLGKCRFGSQCTYSHEIPQVLKEHTRGGTSHVSSELMAAVAVLMVDCPYYQRGHCKYGERCRLRHAPPLPSTFTTPSTHVPTPMVTVAPAASTSSSFSNDGSDLPQEFTCGVCLEDVVKAGKHFGLLACDHCYCVDCLRQWRQSETSDVQNTRACPACRKPSNYIVPSLKFCTGAEKEKVVEEYKRHLSVRECKYFDGSLGSCPFGMHCFYAHRDSSGKDVKHLDRPRKSRRRNNSSLRPDGRHGRDEDVPEVFLSLLDGYNLFVRYLEALDWEETVMVTYGGGESRSVFEIEEKLVMHESVFCGGCGAVSTFEVALQLPFLSDPSKQTHSKRGRDQHDD
ncbi:hypothetical protein PINS_up007356 [Pythium insidiosum]|nr:hypothetical protein PINS_up007356 [Pythium insidiosum]